MIKILQSYPLIIRTYLANILVHCLRSLKLLFGRHLILALFLTIFIYSYNPAVVFAIQDEGGKNIVNNDGDGCINGSSCQVERYSSSGEEVKAAMFGDEWEITNPVCIAVVAAQAVAQVAVSTTADLACSLAVQPGTISLSQLFLAGIGLSPVAYSSLWTQASLCLSLTQAALVDATTALAFQAAACCSAAVNFAGVLALAAAANGIVYGISKDAYENNVMCGNDWLSWSNKSGNNKSKTCRNGAYEGSIKKNLTDCFGKKTSNSCGEEKITNENYRSFIYGGVEYEDNRSDACKNPQNWDSGTKMAKLGYNSENQRYYFTGPGQMPVFACYRFYSPDKTDSDMQEAYSCCKKASQNLTCIAKNSTALVGPSHSTCVAGKKCNLASIIYDVQRSTLSPNRICVSSYSLCPFNHKLGGGTEKKVYSGVGSTLNTQTTTNYCQYLKHCTVTPPEPYVNDITSPDSFVSQSCRDMKGDTQNKNPFTVKFLKGRNFSAPLVQCFKETAENIFFNRAGYSKCYDTNEEPSKDICKSGYQFKKGDPLTKDSVFVKISNSFRDVVRVMLALSVVFMGIKILLGIQPEKKLLLLYIAKIGLIIYFVLGDAWQTMFMKGVFSLSETLTDITMQIVESSDPTKLDGCQFPRFNYIQEDSVANPKYPPGKEYLRVWDTLDCKLAKAIGFVPEVTVPNLIKIILPAIFSSFLAVGGIFFVVAVVFFGLLFFSIVIRAAQISITSTIAIVLLVYISPLAIVAGFFDKTKESFNSWLSQLLGMALQPMIVFAYIGVFVTVFDSVLVGKDVSFVRYDKDPVSITCGEEAKKTSIYCMFNFVEFAESINDSSASNILGLPSFWILQDALGDSFAKSIQLFKCLLILFVFFNAFDHIPSLAVALVGGVKINAKNEIDSTGIAKKVGGGMFKAAKFGSFASSKVLKKAGDVYGQMRTPLPRNDGGSKKDAPESKDGESLIGSGGGSDGARKPSDNSNNSSSKEGRSSQQGNNEDSSNLQGSRGLLEGRGGGDGDITSQDPSSNENSRQEAPSVAGSNNNSQDSANVSSSDESRIELQVNPPVNQSVAQAEKGAPESKDGKSLIGSGGSSDGASKPSDNSNNSSSKEGRSSQQGNNENSSNLQGSRGLLEGRGGGEDSVNRKESNYKDADDEKSNNEEDFRFDIDEISGEESGEDGDSSNKPEESGEDGDSSNSKSEKPKSEEPVKPFEDGGSPDFEQKNQKEFIEELGKQEEKGVNKNISQRAQVPKFKQVNSRYSNDKIFNNYYQGNHKKIDNAISDYIFKDQRDETFKYLENRKSEYLETVKDKTLPIGDRKNAYGSLVAINQTVDKNIKKSLNKNEQIRVELLKTDQKDLNEARKELYSGNN